MDKVFQSKVDTWLVILIIAVFIVPINSILNNHANVTTLAITIGLSISILFVVVSILYKTSYTVSGHLLIVKSGFLLREKYDIDKITNITRTRSLLSAPAPSLDRIAIHFEKKFTPLIISPKDQREFAKYLQSINPKIKIEF